MEEYILYVHIENILVSTSSINILVPWNGNQICEQSWTKFAIGSKLAVGCTLLQALSIHFLAKHVRHTKHSFACPLLANFQLFLIVVFISCWFRLYVAGKHACLSLDFTAEFINEWYKVVSQSKQMHSQWI